MTLSTLLGLRGVFRNEQWRCILWDERDDIIPENFTARPFRLPFQVLRCLDFCGGGHNQQCSRVWHWA
jgi:hypothetical protein